MEAVHQSSQLQLALISILPFNMISKCSENATNVFFFERASCEYASMGVRWRELCAIYESRALKSGWTRRERTVGHFALGWRFSLFLMLFHRDFNT